MGWQQGRHVLESLLPVREEGGREQKVLIEVHVEDQLHGWLDYTLKVLGPKESLKAIGIN